MTLRYVVIALLVAATCPAETEQDGELDLKTPISARSTEGAEASSTLHWGGDEKWENP